MTQCSKYSQNYSFGIVVRIKTSLVSWVEARCIWCRSPYVWWWPRVGRPIFFTVSTYAISHGSESISHHNDDV